MLAYCSPNSPKKQAIKGDSMQLWHYLVFGLVQGLTEFLPVSSSGHLVLLEKLLGFSGDFLFFVVLLHLATLLAVLVALRSQVREVLQHPFDKKSRLLLIATIPTVLMVLAGKQWVDIALEGNFLALAFMFTGVLLLATSMLTKRQKPARPLHMRSAVLMGIAQGFAVVPGISRSGATICTGILAGEHQTESASFSFLMSIPIIVASMVYELFTASGLALLDAKTISFSLLAFVVAFVTGVLAIRWMLKLVARGKLWLFSIYLFVLAGVALLTL